MTDEQKKQRTGKFCASSIHKIMGAKGMGKTGETYVHEVAAEYLTGQPAQPEFSSAATSWGNQHEAEAQKYYETATGNVTEKGKTMWNDFMVGTPDLIMPACGIEIKCPYNSGNHLKNLMLETPEQLKALSPEYYWQIVAYMWITGLDAWKFCSYDPRFKEEKRMLILNMSKNEADIELLKKRIIEAQLLFNTLVA